MPIHLPAAAGKPYRPSNGTEGEMFMERFCDKCTKDNFEKDTEGGCPIIANSMAFNEDDPRYPTEWVFDEEGRPTCKAFDRRESDEE